MLIQMPGTSTGGLKLVTWLEAPSAGYQAEGARLRPRMRNPLRSAPDAVPRSVAAFGDQPQKSGSVASPHSAGGSRHHAETGDGFQADNTTLQGTWRVDVVVPEGRKGTWPEAEQEKGWRPSSCQHQQLDGARLLSTGPTTERLPLRLASAHHPNAHVQVHAEPWDLCCLCGAAGCAWAFVRQPRAPSSQTTAFHLPLTVGSVPVSL